MPKRKPIVQVADRRSRIELCKELHRLYAGKAGIVGISKGRAATAPLAVYVEGEQSAQQRRLIDEIRREAGGHRVSVHTGVAIRRSW